MDEETGGPEGDIDGALIRSRSCFVSASVDSRCRVVGVAAFKAGVAKAFAIQLSRERAEGVGIDGADEEVIVDCGSWFPREVP